MSAQTLQDLNGPLLLLRLFGAEYPHLPAAYLSVSTLYPDQLEMSFHDDLSGFEAWRDALSIASESVVHRVQGKGRTRVLQAEASFAGARLRLTGYAEIPALDAVASGAVVGS
ncbi:hypothetical protein [Streptomyces sp. H27-C3]|uniref:hypothetical protein n=1 Tax=Streptomyces sp. H27-C3 TaxID=3046305 RepID=UPI0024BA400B|nr:hypothetical protein [Streptomyces sp. H27-C3]MDJ0463649.1 hypothetical protein [Streptomyces sp. H27-C3]